MTVVKEQYVFCDICNADKFKTGIGTFHGTVAKAIQHNWVRIGGPSGGGSVPTKHYCPRCISLYRVAKKLGHD